MFFNNDKYKWSLLLLLSGSALYLANFILKRRKQNLKILNINQNISFQYINAGIWQK